MRLAIVRDIKQKIFDKLFSYFCNHICFPALDIVSE